MKLSFLINFCLVFSSGIFNNKFNLQGGSGKVSPLTLDPGGRKSPAEPEDKPRIGLSCLASSTQDEDREPLSVLKSPEKKSIISPSGRSISDIFGKVNVFVYK